MGDSRVLTLFYHRINNLENDFHRLCVSPENFRHQIQYLKNNYYIVRFEDDWTMTDSDAVVITFDDGYLDNLEYAVPILEEFEVPATIFISTGTMDQSKELWWDELEYLLFRGDNIPSNFQLIDTEFEYRWNTDTLDYRKNCYKSLHYLMKYFVGLDKRENWLKQLWEWRGLKRSPRRENLTLSQEQCKKLGESKMISVGAHTVSHPALAALSKREQEIEIKTSIDILSDVLKKRITLFSFPFGGYGTDFNEESIEICKQYGILKAASTDSALWDSFVSSYRIPRKVVRNWNMLEFDEKIKEYWKE